MAKLCPEPRLRRALEALDAYPDEGLLELAELARKYPQDAQLRAMTGMAFVEEGEAWRGLAHLEWAVRHDPHPDWLGWLQQAYEELEMPLHAAQVARRRGAGNAEGALEHLPGAPEGMPRKHQLEFERAQAEILNFDRGGVERLAPVVKAYPHFVDAANLLATGYYLRWDLKNFHRLARANIERWPGDAHALLNAVRSGLLLDGWEGAREWASLLDKAEGSGPADTLATRARVAAHLNDAERFEAITWAQATELGMEDDEELLDLRSSVLADRRTDPEAPLVNLELLLLPMLGAALHGGGRVLPKWAKGYLTGAPGLLKLLPELLGYTPVNLAQMVAALVLQDAAFTDGAWRDVLSRLARHGPGKHATRLGLMQLLVEEGVLPPDESLEVEPPPGDEERRVRLGFGGDPSGLPEAEEERFQEAIDGLTEGDAEGALRILTLLHQQFPDNHQVEHALARAEANSGRADAARTRIADLIRRQPFLLLLRAREAVEAVGAGDLGRAAELLTLPPGDIEADFRDYATFLGARANLAHAEGNADRARALLEALKDVLGEEDGLYLAFAGKIGGGELEDDRN